MFRYLNTEHFAHRERSDIKQIDNKSTPNRPQEALQYHTTNTGIVFADHAIVRGNRTSTSYFSVSNKLIAAMKVNKPLFYILLNSEANKGTTPKIFRFLASKGILGQKFLNPLKRDKIKGILDYLSYLSLPIDPQTSADK